MESTVKQRLIAFIEYLGISKNAFEKACGLSTRYVSNISESVSQEKLKQISLKFPLLNTGWLLTGEGDMLKNVPMISTPEVGNVPCIYNKTTFMSNCDHDCATCHVKATCPNCGVELPDCSYTIIPKEVSYGSDVVIRDWLEQNRDRAKRINFNRILPPADIVTQKMHDRSMEPKIVENSFILYKMLPDWEECLKDGYSFDGTVFGIDVAKPHLIFRKVYNEGDKLRCVPVNSDYAPTIIDKDKVTGVYEVWAILRLCKETI